MKMLTQITHYVFGKPKDKYHIYKRGDGKYIAGFGGKKSMKAFQNGVMREPIEYDSIRSAESAIERHRSFAEQKEVNNKLSHVKEIA